MATTYTVAANHLEGVIIRFAPHPVIDFPFLHHTLNGVYGVDLYETDFHFLSSDFATNGQTELYKDAPKRLLVYMINHIKTVSAASVSGTGTRSNATKVDELFGKMLLSNITRGGKIIDFQRGKSSQQEWFISSRINAMMYQQNVWKTSCQSPKSTRHQLVLWTDWIWISYLAVNRQSLH